LLDPPLNASALKLADGDEEVFDPDPEKPLWRILVPGGSSCEDDCRQVLHYTRQIHTAMGKYQNRIERLMVLSSQPAESALSGLQAEYPSLKVLYTPRAGMEALTSTQAGSASAAYFLVDPQGWVILSYPGDADGKDIMADLKFLLKNSNG
jgi:cytochrome oxidase Cu insertion factor (SCO1/SenC/PrrC family)